jgi:hypothetical protein
MQLVNCLVTLTAQTITFPILWYFSCSTVGSGLKTGFLLIFFYLRTCIVLFYRIIAAMRQTDGMILVEFLPGPRRRDPRMITDVCSICWSQLNTDQFGVPHQLQQQPDHWKLSCCVTPCDHLYHRTCLASWLEREDTCPLCRRRLIEARSQHGEVFSLIGPLHLL